MIRKGSRGNSRRHSTVSIGSRRSSVYGSSSSLYEPQRRHTTGGDPCSSHRGTSPSTPRRGLSKRSANDKTIQRKNTPSPRPNNSLSGPRHRKNTVYHGPKKQISPEAGRSEFERLPSSRSRKLYRFTRNFSDGFSESEPEDWFSGSNRSNKKIKKKMKPEKAKIMALAKFLKSPRQSSTTIPEVLIEDFSDKKAIPRINKNKLKALTSFLSQKGNKIVDIDKVEKSIPRINKTKLKALTSFMNQNGNKIVDIEEVDLDAEELVPTTRSPVNKTNIKNKLSAVSKLNSFHKTKVSNHDSESVDKKLANILKSSKSKITAISSFNTKANENKSKKGEKVGFKKLNKSKIIALTSFTKHGKEEVQLVEVNSDSDEDLIEDKQSTIEGPVEINESRESTEKKETIKEEISKVKIKLLCFSQLLKIHILEPLHSFQFASLLRLNMTIMKVRKIFVKIRRIN